MFIILFLSNINYNVCGKIHYRTEHHVRRNIFGRAKMARDFVTLYTVYRNSSKLRISLQLFL